MGFLSYLRDTFRPQCRERLPEETPEDKVLRRANTIKQMKTPAQQKEKKQLITYLKRYDDPGEYGIAGGKLSGKFIKDLAMTSLIMGDKAEMIIQGLPSLNPGAECGYASIPELEVDAEDDDGSEYEDIFSEVLSDDNKEIAALGIIGGINKLLHSGIVDDAIHKSILTELKSLGYTYPEIAKLAPKIKSHHVDLDSKLSLIDNLRGGKRARRVRRTKRTKGKSRGRARKATRVRRNNNNSNKTKRNKGKKRRTKRA